MKKYLFLTLLTLLIAGCSNTKPAFTVTNNAPETIMTFSPSSGPSLVFNHTDGWKTTITCQDESKKGIEWYQFIIYCPHDKLVSNYSKIK